MGKVNIGPVISRESEPHPGYGSGPGSVDTTVFECPCGKGTYTISKDNIPGFRETDYSLDCKECLKNYDFDPLSGTITEKK